MNAFTIAATALLIGYLPLGWVILTQRALDGFVALQLAGTIAVLVLLCLAEGFHRSFEYSVAIVAVVTSWTGALLFARFFGRWL